MSLRIWQIGTVLLAALLMATAFGHVLEMPMKMNAGAQLWLTYQHTLYAWFAIVGGPIEILTILAAAGLAWRARRHPRLFRPTVAAAILFAAAFFAIWLGLTNPVNARTASWTADSIPADWERWRAQWEYSHAARFALQFAALWALVVALAREGQTPASVNTRERR